MQSSFPAKAPPRIDQDALDRLRPPPQDDLETPPFVIGPLEDNRIDIAIIGDGYTASELETVYPDHVDALLNALFGDRPNNEPFATYAEYFNIHVIDLVSEDSGADDPSTGTFVDTALDATYFFDGVTERLLYVDHVKAANAIETEMAQRGYTAEMEFVLVNDAKYGGGGGRFAVYAADNEFAIDIAIHEVGHSYALLADEYDYSGGATYTGAEPQEPNVTTDPTGAKWSEWIGYDDPVLGPIGAFESGYYHTNGIWRPSEDGQMRSLGQPFHAVSREAFILEYYADVDPLDDWAYRGEMQAISDPDTLWVTPIDASVVETIWSMDGAPVGTGTTLDLEALDLTEGTYSFVATTSDATGWVRRDLDTVTQTVQWTVDIETTQDPDGSDDVPVSSVQNTSEPYIVAQTAGTTYNGDSSDQTYNINPFLIQSGADITIIDQGGDNIIELPAGLEIVSSLSIADQTILTLSNDAVVDIRGADTFTFNVGQNLAAGDTVGTSLTFAEFAEGVLGVTLPADGAPVAAGGTSVINDDGSADVDDNPIDMTSTFVLSADAPTVDEGQMATFTLTTTNVAAGTVLAYTITGVSSVDVFGGLTGTVAVGTAGTADISVEIIEDQLTEGPETLTLSLDNGEASTSTVVQDTSVANTNTYISGQGGNGVFSDFNIELVFGSAFSTAERAAFEMAADYLSSVIMGDLPDEFPIDDGRIDDIRITAVLEPIDGPFGTLGFAGPTALRFGGDFLPSQGQMTFDTADTARQATEGTLVTTVLHEMFHALGFGTFTGFSNNVSDGAEPRFTGANAIAAYNAEFPGLSGADVLSAFGVPLDGGHWPEALFANEILTPILNDVTDYVSGLTIATLEDLGYDTIFDINVPGATVPQLNDFMFV